MSAHQLRKLRPLTPVSGAEIEINGKIMLNFCSNDYLGLSKHPEIKKRAAQYLKKFGAGATASRLICGSFDCFSRVEEKIARLKQTQSALILNSGFQANTTILSALADKNSLILSDQLNHNSLIQGARLCRCKIAIMEHNNPHHLREILEQSQKKFSRILIVTESVFSMDGDRPDIDGLVQLSEEFGALLIVDEAHATGVLGENGMGLTCGKDVDVAIGTFGKALGSFGSYVACSDKIKSYLVNCCSGFIYSTALPPAVIGAIDAALDLVVDMDKERRNLHENSDLVRLSLKKLGWSTGESSTQIIPIIIGDEQQALDISAYLEENNILAAAIRPPTVRRSRIRLSLSAAHTRKQVEHLISVFQKWGQANGAS